MKINILSRLIWIFGRIKVFKYFSWLFLSLFASYLSLILFNGDIDNARYFLSAIAQSQAAIVGLSITILFLFVQLFSERYSFRITEFVIKNKRLWAVIITFFLSILLDLFFIGILVEESTYLIVIMALAMGFMVISLILLINFILQIPHIIDVSQVIFYLVSKLSKKRDKIIRRIFFREHKYEYIYWQLKEETEMYPLVEIIKESIKKGDSHTSVKAINGLKNIYSYIFLNCVDYFKGSEEKEKEFSIKETRERLIEDFNDHILDIWRIAFKEKDDNAIDSIVETTKDVYCINLDSLQAARNSLSLISYGVFHKSLLKSKRYDNLKHNLDNLFELGNEISRRYPDKIIGLSGELVETLKLIIEDIKGDNNLRDLQENILKFLSSFCVYLTKNDMVPEFVSSSEIIKETIERLFKDWGVGFAYAMQKDLIKSCLNIITFSKSYERYFTEFFKNTLSTIILEATKLPVHPLVDNCLKSIEEVTEHSFKSSDSKIYFNITLNEMMQIASTDCEQGVYSFDRFLRYFEKWCHKESNFFHFLESLIKSSVNIFMNRLIKSETDRVRWDDDWPYYYMLRLLRELKSNKQYGKLVKLTIVAQLKSHESWGIKDMKDNCKNIRKRLGIF